MALTGSSGRATAFMHTSTTEASETALRDRFE
jgi:hypothetical protein